MNYKEMFLEKATKWVVGGDLYEEVKSLVAFYFTEDGMNGPEKREAVIAKAKVIAEGVASVFINIAIEVAYLIILSSQINAA